MSDKENKKFDSSFFKKIGIKFGEAYDHLQSNIPALVVTFITSIVIMGLAACAIFFANIKGAEKVLVPNVEGKKLEDALLEMQVKELYPKISLRYSDLPGDQGLILEQSPKAGAIVRGYSRVNLVVSRGVIVDKVGGYVGQNFDELKMNLQTLFAGTANPLIVLEEPMYKPDVSAAGTILEQDPPEGTDISEPVKLSLVVSRGPSFENTRVPRLTGLSINDMLQTVARSRIIFEFTSRPMAGKEKPGTVVSQQQFESEFIPNYSRMGVEMAFPNGEYEDNVYGIFSTEITEYPYPVPMRLDATSADGNTYTLVNFMHTGLSISLPYAVPKETTLTLYVVDKEQKKIIVH